MKNCIYTANHLAYNNLLFVFPFQAKSENTFVPARMNQRFRYEDPSHLEMTGCLIIAGYCFIRSKLLVNIAGQKQSGMIYLTRRERFCAAHRMFREDWSDETNLEVFGKCSNPNWHGHNYVLWVTVKGETSPENGFVMNINKLKEIINEKVIIKVDHRNINLDVDFMKGKIAC